MEPSWYYAKDNDQHGPISEEKLQQMLQSGTLGRETLVWSEIIPDWVPASKLERFKMESGPEPPPLPPEPPQLPKSKKTVEIKDALFEDVYVSQNRPWIRFWARYLDILIFGLLCGFSVGYFFPEFTSINQILMGMVLLFAWIFFEASLLSTFGTTLGKWLFKIKVRTSPYGEKLKFGNAISRSFSVWLIGLGLGIPIVTLVTQLVSYSKLKKSGKTSWDEEGGYRVIHDKIGPVQGVATVIIFVSLFLFIGWLNSYSIN